MGWLSQFIDDAQNTVKSVGQSIADVIHDPLNANNLRSLGGAIVKPLTDAKGYVVDAAVANADGAKNVAVGAYTTYVTGGLNILGQNAGVNRALRDPTASKLTFGASTDFAGASNASGQWLSGQRGSKADEEGALRFGVKYGTAVAAATAYGVAAGAGSVPAVTPSGAGLTYSGAQAAAHGDVAGVVDAGLGGAGLENLSPLTELLPGAPGPTYNLGGVKYQLPAFDTSQVGQAWPPISTGTGIPGAQNAAVSPLLVAAGVVAAVYIARKRGII